MTSHDMTHGLIALLVAAIGEACMTDVQSAVVMYIGQFEQRR